jgi:hypothetical protein
MLEYFHQIFEGLGILQEKLVIWMTQRFMTHLLEHCVENGLDELLG